MRECYEYKLHRNHNGNLIQPSWIERGGFLFQESTKTYVGFTPVENERDYFVPDEVLKLDKAAFVSRGIAIHGNDPFINDEKIDARAELPISDLPKMTNTEANAYLNKLWDENVA